MKPLLSDKRIWAIAQENLYKSTHADNDIRDAIKQALSEQSNIIDDWLETEAERLEEKYFASAATYRAIAKQLAE